MKTHLQKILANAPCDYAEFRYQETSSTLLSFDGSGLRDVSINSARGGFVRVLADGKFGAASFDDVDRAAEYLEKAISLARLRTGDFAGFAPVEVNVDDVLVDVPRPASDVDLDEKVEVVNKYNQIWLDHDRIPATETRYGDFLDYRVFVNTEGAAVTVRKPRVNLSLRPLASEGGVVQMAIRNYGGLVSFDHLLGRE